MPNYEPCGLTSTDFARIAGSVQEAPLRLKFLKPMAYSLPDSDTTNIDKIDDGTHHDPPSTANLLYEKIIYDDHAGRERTIVLHSVLLNNASSVVSVINHDTGDVDEIYKDALLPGGAPIGWSSGYAFGPSRDIDYNPHTNELAIMVRKADNTAALFVINLNKYSQELTSCNTLALNPDYLRCSIYDHTGVLAGYAMRFVRHYKSRWYCWIGDLTGGTAGRADIGYFDAAGDWNSMWMQHRAWSDPAPQFKNITPVGVLGSGSYGDPMCVLGAPKTMEITEDGELIMGLMPIFNTEYFGNETMIVRINLDSLEDMSDPDTGTLATVALSHTFSGTVTAGVKATGGATITAEDVGMERIDQCGIYEISLTYAAGGTGTATPAFYVRCYVETDAGTVEWQQRTERFFVFSSNGVFNFGIAAYSGFAVSGGDGQKTINATLKIRKFPSGLVECLNVHSETPIVAAADAVRPAVGSPEFTGGPSRALVVDVSGVTTVPTRCHYSGQSSTYAFSVDSGSGVHQGLMTIRTPGVEFRHFMEADGLYDDFIRTLKPIGSDTFLVVSGFYGANQNNVVQIFNADTATLGSVADGYTMTYVAGVTHAAVSVGYSAVNSAISLATENEIWIFRPNTTNKWSRDIRVWWDGSQPDKDLFVAGDSEAIRGLNFSDEKGLASSSCSFEAMGAGFLPWKKSSENEDYNNPGAYSPLLTYGTRIQIYRGIRQAGGAWKWIDEAQVVVTELPENLERGIVNIPVQCEGLAAHIFTKAIYEYFHEPTREQSDPDGDGWVLLTRILPTFPDAPADLHLGHDFGFYLNYVGDENPGLRTTDWVSFPPPEVQIDGVETRAYQIDYRRGLVRFAINQCDTEPPYFQIPTTIDANFYRYVPGTNEVEDIIWCICTHPNDVGAEMGGAGLDEGYITDTRTDDPLTLADDGLSATFPRDNLYAAADVVIKRNGVVWAASNYNWGAADIGLRTGTVYFNLAQLATFTSTYKHFTLQASGITAPPMQFTDKDDGTALDCIERASQMTHAYNYIFKARRDGKFESDYYIQKTTADITITDNDIILEHLIRDPADEDCYSAVVSYGQYPEGELPNLAMGIVPSDDWWNISGQPWIIRDGSPIGPAAYLEYITDNDVFTQQSGGWGKSYGGIRGAVGLAEDGLPAFTIDLGAIYEVDQIVFVRGEGNSAEGGYEGIQTQSIWGSQTNPTPADPMPATWEQVIPPFQSLPAATVNFKGGQDWPEGRRWRYLCVNVHDIGLYLWERIDSQISFAEFQAFESEFIRGYAQLQDTDPDAALYDFNGILKKHGLLTLVARDGQPDETLVTQELADADAAAVLTEVSQYTITHTLSSCPLPGVDILTTVRVENTILNSAKNFFISNRSFGEYKDRDSLDGTYVP